MFYELYLRSFCDGNGDGIGDFIGAERRLDYLADLGIEGIWLLPILHSMHLTMATVSSISSVSTQSGTLKDLRNFLAHPAHKLDLKILRIFR